MRKYDVPHYVDDTKDACRCVESSFRMCLKYFLPREEYNWRRLDKFLHKPRKKGAWWFSIYPYLIKKGFEVREYTNVSLYKGLLKEGTVYLYEHYPKEFADFYMKESNIKEAIKLIPLVLKEKVFHPRIKSVKGILRLLDEGYLIIADVNFSRIYGKKGFDISHSVIIVGYDSKNIYINDPAKDRGKGVPIPNKRFMNAWHNKEMVALRKI